MFIDLHLLIVNTIQSTKLALCILYFYFYLFIFFFWKNLIKDIQNYFF